MELRINDLKKTYGSVKALKGISYSFTPGVYGILGANGAGKSTMINLITDNVSRDKDGGSIIYCDGYNTCGNSQEYNCDDNEKTISGEPLDILKLGAKFRGIVGYMPQQQGFYEDFSPKAFLKYMAEIKGVKAIKSVDDNGKVTVKKVGQQIDELLGIVRGFSPFWAAVIITIITTIVTMYLISGFTVKTICAIAGTVTGVLLAGLSAWLFGKVADIDGYNVSNIETLSYVGQITNIQIGGLLFSGILIASLGAVMDVAMSVSSAMYEIHDKAPQLGCLELFKSGMNVGRDMMGTMSNTLILAFVGSAVSELVINYAYNLPFRQIINSYNIGIEIMQGVSGSIGVILTVPAVAVVTAWLLTHRHGNIVV